MYYLETFLISLKTRTTKVPYNSVQLNFICHTVNVVIGIDLV